MIQVIGANKSRVMNMKHRSFGHTAEQLEDLRSLDILFHCEKVSCRGISTKIFQTWGNSLESENTMEINESNIVRNNIVLNPSYFTMKVGNENKEN